MEEQMMIRRFAAFVVIEFSEMHCADKNLIGILGDFNQDDNYKEIFKSIKLLLTFYGDTIDDFDIETIDNMGILSSKKKFLAFLLSRCLKLSGDKPDFFEFLLVCIYIVKTVKSIYEKFRCCKVLKVAADCLEAVYGRKYREHFLKNDEFLGFSRYCRVLNRSPYSVELRNGKDVTFIKAVKPERNEKVILFQSLKDVDDVLLYDKEEKLLKNLGQPFFTSDREDEDFLITTTGRADDTRDPDLTGWESVPEKALKTGVRCSHCCGKCAQYTTYLSQIFPRMKKASWFSN